MAYVPLPMQELRGRRIKPEQPWPRAPDPDRFRPHRFGPSSDPPEPPPIVIERDVPFSLVLLVVVAIAALLLLGFSR